MPVYRRIEQDKTLLFMHMPKVAGTTFRAIMTERYPESAIYRIYDDFFGRCQQKLDRFASLPLERRKRIPYVEGHMRFGIHAFVPTPCAYITFLRSPVERLRLVYSYILTRPNHDLYDVATNMSFRDFIESEAAFRSIYNNQTQHVSGLRASEILGAKTEEVLDRAYANIEEHFALVGCSELFDESLLLFRRAIGWKGFPFYTRRNVTTHKSSREPVAEETRALINEVHKLDCTLYAAMKARFESACRGIDGFEEEVAVFKEQNAHFQKQKKSIGLPSSSHGSWAFLKHLTRHAIRLKRKVL